MAAVPKEADPISDEEWLVFKAHECLKSDSHAAKAWLMTAKSLFPRNFDIQVHGTSYNADFRLVFHLLLFVITYTVRTRSVS